ncbi:hypothetical protein L596_001257 [Steinernema carpocapsae]|uniref:Uncharacterized protein n=1 Tax=Steinernema carpocapsae TaxID=34508 RepID=A0A4U8UMS3_STECR|nr:hypothetical protein L596_001257 [Steinernema carpocapsae]
MHRATKSLIKERMKKNDRLMNSFADDLRKCGKELNKAEKLFKRIRETKRICRNASIASGERLTRQKTQLKNLKELFIEEYNSMCDIHICWVRDLARIAKEINREKTIFTLDCTQRHSNALKRYQDLKNADLARPDGMQLCKFEEIGLELTSLQNELNTVWVRALANDD